MLLAGLESARASDWRRLAALSSDDSLLDGNLLSESLEWVVTLKDLELTWSVLVQELVNGEESTANLDEDLASLDLDHHATGAELVDALRLAHEHDLQLLAVGVVVDVLGELQVDRVGLDRDVDGDALLKVNDVGLKRLALSLEITDSLEQL